MDEIDDWFLIHAIICNELCEGKKSYGSKNYTVNANVQELSWKSCHFDQISENIKSWLVKFGQGPISS